MPDRQAQIREFGVGVAVPQMPFRSKGHAEDETFRAVEPAMVEPGCRSRRSTLASDAVRHAAVAGSTAITLTPWRAPKRAAAAASAPRATGTNQHSLGGHAK